MQVKKHLSEKTTDLRHVVLYSLLTAASVGGLGINAACEESEVDSKDSLSSTDVIQATETGELPILASGPTYKIYDAGVKRYVALTALVQSSKTPISLGAEMRPYMDTQRYWKFVRSNGIAIPEDSPQEIYVYNWIEKAQGKMVFDVGAQVGDKEADRTFPKWLQIKSYKPMKFASLVYVGPFPHQEGSGWEEIRWEDRARDKGCVYDERMYRELYHRFDYQKYQHITEIQISVE